MKYISKSRPFETIFSSERKKKKKNLSNFVDVAIKTCHRGHEGKIKIVKFFKSWFRN